MSKVWCWTALAVAAIPGAALASQQSAVYQLPGHVAVNVGGGPVNADGSGVSSSTSVDLHSVVGDTKLSGTFTSAPPDPSAPADRTDSKLGLNSDFHVPGGVDLKVTASSEVSTSRQNGALVPAGLASTSATTKSDSAGAAATAHPLSDVAVTVGMKQSSSVTAQANVPVGGRPQSSTVTTGDRKVHASAEWQALPFLALKAGAANETMNVSAHGMAADADEFRYTEPHASATAKLWDGAQVKLSGQDAVSPVNPYDYAALAQAGGGNMRVEPNREWRNQAILSQSFDNGGSASVGVTQARVESTTEIGLTAAGMVAPMSIAGGARRELDANVTMPLSIVGLDDTTLTSQAALRRSRVTDPVTGQPRRMSGEIPREAHVRVTHKDNAHHLEWGVTGNLATEQSFYQPAQVTTLHTGSGVGAFVTYKPGKYVVSLNADGLIGGSRSQIDDIYLGSRAGNLETTNRTTDSSPLVSVSVSQSF